MKENLNPKPDSLNVNKQCSSVKNSNSKSEEISYDLSNVGDAALLAVLNEKSNEDEDVNSEDSTNQEVTIDSGQTEKPEIHAKSKEYEKSKNSGETEKSVQTKDLAERKKQISVVNSLLSLVMKLMSGEVPEEKLLKLMDAAEALSAIEEARKEGEIAGRNALIEERLRPAGIGIPDLNGAPAPSRPKTSSIFDLALGAR